LESIYLQGGKVFLHQPVKKIFLLIVTSLLFSCCSGEKIFIKPSGLSYIDNKVGTGREAKIGDTVAVHFKAWLIKDSPDPFNQKSDDSTNVKLGDSYRRNKPIEFVLTDNNFIKGSEQGISGMKKGGIRTIIIPANLIYGNAIKNPHTTMDSNIKLIIELVQIK